MSYDKGDYSHYAADADRPPSIPTRESIDAARSFLDACCGPLDTRGAAYLASRGLDPKKLPPGDVVLAFNHRGGHDLPIGGGIAFVGSIAEETVVDGKTVKVASPAFVQVLYLTDDGSAVTETHPKSKRQQKRRRNIGVQTGAPAFMQGGGSATKVLLCEGAEDALTAWQVTGHHTLASFGTSGMAYAPEFPTAFERVILSDNDAPGAAAAEKCAINYARRDGVAARIATPADPAKDVNDLYRVGGAAAVATLVNGAVAYAGFIEPKEAPAPLTRKLIDADPYPIEALGALIGGAVSAAVDIHQCPVALAAGSALAVASLVVQGRIDVVHPRTGDAIPTSLFLVEFGSSGERKSAVDARLSQSLKQHEARLRAKYKEELEAYARNKRLHELQVKNIEKDLKTNGAEAVEASLKLLGPEPEPPLEPTLTCDAPTPQGYLVACRRTSPSQGIFNSEGGSFLGGTGFSAEKVAESVAIFNKCWDGAPLSRTLVSDHATLHGRRTALHLMLQPILLPVLFANSVVVQSGFSARLLVSFPASTIGTRLEVGRIPHPANEKKLQAFDAAATAILETPMPLKPDTRELDPRPVPLSKEATERWEIFCDGVEAELKPEGALGRVVGFGAKLAEHVLRISGVIAGLENPNLIEISLDVLERAIELGDFYATEMARLQEMGTTAPELDDAALLLKWLHGEWKEPLIGLVAIYQLGPSKLRSKAHAERAVKTLVDHAWLIPFNGKDPVVRGAPVTKAWHVRRPA